MSKQEHWLDDVEEHDYAAAQEYLSLLMPDGDAERLAQVLRSTAVPAGNIRWFKAKDILRASGLPALPESNAHVNKDFRKVKDGEKLSPVLLLRGNTSVPRPLIIADGYHRVCASYLLDENAEIPARIL